MKSHPHRLDGNRAFIPLAPGWAKPEMEATLMHWITSMLRPPRTRASGLDWGRPEGPFGPRDTGYRWQLDGSNDWWAQITLEGELILAARYSYQPLKELAGWVAACVGRDET